MGDKMQLLITILLFAFVLFFALKFGVIGGAGAGTKREEEPIIFWLGVGLTSIFLMLLVVVLVVSYL